MTSTLIGDSDIASLLPQYLTLLCARLAALREAVALDRRGEIGQLAHDLAGAAGGYGFKAITDAARALEATVRDVQPDRLRDHANEVFTLCERALGDQPVLSEVHSGRSSTSAA